MYSTNCHKHQWICEFDEYKCCQKCLKKYSCNIAVGSYQISQLNRWTVFRFGKKFKGSRLNNDAWMQPFLLLKGWSRGGGKCQRRRKVKRQLCAKTGSSLVSRCSIVLHCRGYSRSRALLCLVYVENHYVYLCVFIYFSSENLWLIAYIVNIFVIGCSLQLYFS